MRPDGGAIVLAVGAFWFTDRRSGVAGPVVVAVSGTSGTQGGGFAVCSMGMCSSARAQEGYESSISLAGGGVA